MRQARTKALRNKCLMHIDILWGTKYYVPIAHATPTADSQHSKNNYQS
jgi:hypothetical protein